MSTVRARIALLLLLPVFMVAGCVYVPRTTTTYDKDCEIETRSMKMEAYQIASIGRCSNQDCAVLLAAAGVVGAASAVVSGSVVVTGNVVYWLEEKGKCLGSGSHSPTVRQQG